MYRPALISCLVLVALATIAAVGASGAQFDVTSSGAAGDGVTLDTAAIQKAIDACAAAGGGKVVFPKGRYLTGSLELKSGVHLQITPETVVVGSSSIGDYPTRKLIRAKDVHDVGIEGGGTIDGQGESFWEKRDVPYKGPDYRGTAQFNYRALSRPSFLHFQGSRDVVIEGVTLKNSPSWTVHLQRCEGARVENVTIRNPLYGPNTDGIDINSCADVVVRGCDIITGDDGVVLKSTEPGHDHPSRNITVEGCRIWSACNTLKIGTETHDSFENIVFRDCHLYCDSERSLDRPLSGVAIESVDGAHLSNVTVSDITMQNVRAPIFIRLGHRGGNSSRTQQVEPRVPGRIQNVRIRDVTARHSMFESSITGIPGHAVEDIALENVRLEYEGGGSQDWILGGVPDEAVIRRYPEAQMFGRLPAYGLYCRHVRGLQLQKVEVSYLTPDPRPMLVADDVADLILRQVRVAAVASRLPVIWLLDTRNVSIEKCTAPAETAVFAVVEGDEPAHNSVRLSGNTLPEGATPLERLTPRGLIERDLPRFAEIRPGLVSIDVASMRLVDPMAVVRDPDAPSGRYIAVPPSGIWNAGAALCRFEISEPGEYEIWAEVFGDSGESNSFYATIDQGLLALNDVDRLGRWHWAVVRNRSDDRRRKAVYSLKRGDHTLQIRNRESGTRIAAIVIARTGLNYDPNHK